jgi:pre-mRNA-processing factor 6
LPGQGEQRGGDAGDEPGDAGLKRKRLAEAEGEQAKLAKEEQQAKQFDEFLGNDTGIFAGNKSAYDEDDKEADAIWEAVDARMLERRRERREERMKKELEQYRKENPKITEQFQDLKRALGGMSSQDWEAIPEIGDRSVKRTPRGKASFVPVPDTLLARAAQEKQTMSTIDEGSNTSVASMAGTTTTDLTAVGEGRGTVLSMKLDRLGDSVTGQTHVDPKGYLTSLSSVKVTSHADIQDIKKARKLLQSVTSTNPKHAPGWIAAARLESDLGKGSAARQIISRGCKECPKSEDVWLHAALLEQNQDDKKVVIARGISHCPTSVKLWMEASRLENDNSAKTRVLRRALERMPNSVRLWKQLVDLSSEEDARVLLKRAVECCPQHIELWLALAKLENYDSARKVLNKARQTLPTEPLIWITAAKLEEEKHNSKAKANGEEEMQVDEDQVEEVEEVPMVTKLVDRAIKSLRQQGVVVTREKWMSFAEDCEKGQPPALFTCSAIVQATVGMDVDEEDMKATWVADAEECLKRESVHTARSIYVHALSVFPSKKGLWRRAAMLEKQKGTSKRLDAVLKRAVTYCPTSEMLWLMGAKERWLAGDVAGARIILQEAFTANPESEQIVLAAFKLEFQNKEVERAKMLLQRARDQGGKERVWIKSAVLERELGNLAEEKRLVQEGCAKFPSSWKLWLMLAQVEEKTNTKDDHLARARQAYEKGIKACPGNFQLRQSAASLEEREGFASRSRAMLEQARFKVPKTPELWLAAFRLERRQNNDKAAETLMARALQECPESGLLWSEAITSAPRPQRKSRSVDALKKCNNDPLVISAVAQLFMSDHKVDKARNWFSRAIALDPDLGDNWAHLYRFECAFGGNSNAGNSNAAAAGGGSNVNVVDVIRRCTEADPKHGERWQRVAKTPPSTSGTTDTTTKQYERTVESILELVAIDIDKHPIPLP